jgi:hypothetical protein
MQFLQELFGKKRNILRTFTQGRQVDLRHLQAVIQIGPKKPLFDVVRQVAVGRGDDPRIDLDRLVAPSG